MVIADVARPTADLGAGAGQAAYAAGPCAALGDPGAIVLAGPPAPAGAESLEQHLTRLGRVPDAGADEVLAAIGASGLQGRGGGSFPLSRKMEVALASGDERVLVINCSESEPASRKDWVLCCHRPHTLLDGAAALARVLRSAEVVVHLHGWASAPREALRAALRERASLPGEPVWRMSYGPGGYVAGEASAVARYLHAGIALPLFSSAPLARGGPCGRPTVVTNAETAAHVAHIVRRGAAAWSASGTEGSPGPHLVTVSGVVPDPGQVAEVVGPATIGDILDHAGLLVPPQAVLVGGYAGTWVPGHLAWDTPWTTAGLREVGAARGCGLLGVLPHGRCGLAETARLVRYMAAESAGQCGPCVFGLPILADCMSGIAAGRGVRRSVHRLRRTADALPGSGACAHPDGVVRLVLSALEVFGDDVVRHRRGTVCRSAPLAGLFPLVEEDS
jgi:NADH:ubiquinone oxidoreductase subunit F (NADH-binding)